MAIKEVPLMNSQMESLVERLLRAGNPGDLEDWELQDGHYVSTCRVSAADVPGLIKLALKWNDPDWPADGEPPVDGEPPADGDCAALIPVTAWRSLADLKDGAAVRPLVDILSESDDDEDDWLFEELPHVFGKIGEASIEPLTVVATDHRRTDFVRSIAASGLRYVGEYYPQTRDRIVAILTDMMKNATEDQEEFNSMLLTELVDLHAVEAAEPIERAFAANLLDVSMRGDWEEVRKELGVAGLGLKMPEYPRDSTSRLRREMGIGIFSDKPIFDDGQRDDGHRDDNAQREYFIQAHVAFSQSNEAKHCIERYGEIFWFRSLLEYGLNHFGEIIDEMTLRSVQEFVFDYVPRKVSTEAHRAAEIIDELTRFWQYLDRVHRLPAAKGVVEWLQTDGLARRLEAKLSNPANFGMAKSIIMQGTKAGYDMTTQEGMAKFIEVFNRSLQAQQASAKGATPHQRVGRNEPCPCGSGQKFKKCCGGAGQRA